MLESVKILAMIFAIYSSASGGIPPKLIGRWAVETAYDTPGPMGLDAKQEEFIKSIDIVYTSKSFYVCSKRFAVQSINKISLTRGEFLQTYGFLPRLIGFEGKVTDITLNSSNGIGACGDFEDPGAHIFIAEGDHVVIEVANEYFSLKRRQRCQESTKPRGRGQRGTGATGARFCLATCINVACHHVSSSSY